MKLLALALLTLNAHAADPQPAPACPNLTGAYTLPQSKEDFVEGIKTYLVIDQKACVGMDYYIGSPGIIPISPPAIFDDTKPSGDGVLYSIVKNSIVMKATSGNHLDLQTSKHGSCEMRIIALSLDANQDMLLTTPNATGCDDHFTGAYVEHAPRVAQPQN